MEPNGDSVVESVSKAELYVEANLVFGSESVLEAESNLEAEFQEAQARLREVQRESRIFVAGSISGINNDFKAVKRELERVVEEYNRQERRKNEVIRRLEAFSEARIETVVVPYAKTSCLRLVRNMQNAGCPREIRDKIYAFYWRGWNRGSIASAMIILHERWKVRCPAPDKPCRCLRPLKYHHKRPEILDPEYVGPHIAAEALEYWYFAESPKTLITSMNLKKFLSANMLHLGVSPAMALRKLHLIVNLTSTTIPERCGHKSGLQYFPGSLEENLKALEDIRCKRGFKLLIELHFFERPTTLKSVKSVLDHIAPTFQLMKREGANVQVQFKWYPRGSEIRPFRFEMNDYFELQRKNWCKRLESDITERCENSSSYRSFFSDSL